MPYLPPRTWSTGETVTAAIFNLELRDNPNALRTRDLSVAVSMVNGQSIPSSVWTDLVWDDTHDDGGGFFDGTSAFRIPVSGRYAYGGALIYNSNSTGTRSLALTLNTLAPSTLAQLLFNQTAGSIDAFGRLWVAGMRTLIDGDVLRLMTIQTSGASLLVGDVSTFGPRAASFWCYRASDN